MLPLFLRPGAPQPVSQQRSGKIPRLPQHHRVTNTIQNMALRTIVTGGQMSHPRRNKTVFRCTNHQHGNTASVDRKGRQGQRHVRLNGNRFRLQPLQIDPRFLYRFRRRKHRPVNRFWRQGRHPEILQGRNLEKKRRIVGHHVQGGSPQPPWRDRRHQHGSPDRVLDLELFDIKRLYCPLDHHPPHGMSNQNRRRRQPFHNRQNVSDIFKYMGIGQVLVATTGTMPSQ